MVTLVFRAAQGKQQGFGGCQGEYGGFFPHRSIVKGPIIMAIFLVPGRNDHFLRRLLPGACRLLRGGAGGARGMGIMAPAIGGQRA